MESQFDYFFDCSDYATENCNGDCDSCNFHPDYLEEMKYQKTMGEEDVCLY